MSQNSDAKSETREKNGKQTDNESTVEEKVFGAESKDVDSDDNEEGKSLNKEKKSSKKSQTKSKERAAELKPTTSKNSGSLVNRKFSSRSKSRLLVDDLGNIKIGFVGAGRMTDCITRGLIRSEKISSKQLFVSARSTKSFETFKVQGITTTVRPYEIFAKLDCDIVFLCMHGFVIRNCFKMGGIRPFPLTTNYIPWKRKRIVILSLIGGIPLNDIKITLFNPEQTQKYQADVHRLMLNASVAYNLGYGLIDIELDSKACQPIIRNLLQLLGKIEYIDATHMDAACALAGNGLAFIYYFIKSLGDGGFKLGLPRDRATKLACKTLQSASVSLLETNKTPMDLRDEITGPSGAAIYGMNVMDKKDFCGGVINAVETAYRRILELVDCEKV